MFNIRKFLNSRNIIHIRKNYNKTFSEQKIPEKIIFKKENDEYPPNEKLNIDEKLIFNLNEYKQANFYFSNEKYRISQEFYKRVLVYFENNNQKNTDNYIFILKKMISTAILLKNYKYAENHLEKIIEIYQSRENHKAVYRQYNNLILHLLKTDIKKAIKLSKALMSEKEKNKIPNHLLKFFIFNLGTAYLLKGNFVDAKNRLRECLILQPNHTLKGYFYLNKNNNFRKGYALNNLAVASWWHKSPNYREQSDGDDSQNEPIHEDYPSELIETDFNNALPLLKSSISHFEKLDFNPNSELNEKIRRLLDDDAIFKGEQNIEILLEKKESQTPLLNMAEFLYFARPDKSNEATFWIRYVIKFYEKYDALNMDRCIISLAQICKTSSRFETAEALFRKALEMLEESDSYNKILCLLLYGKMLKELPNRAREGEKLIAQSYALGSKLPFWSNKLSNTFIPKLDL